MWGTSSSYGIGMVSGQLHGDLNDYAMTFQMNNDDDRGFVWRDEGMSSSQAAMSLSTRGRLSVADTLKVGYGISDTGGTSYDLQVSGTGYITADLWLGDQILHIGDSDTYIQFHAADQWRVVTGGSERFEVNNTNSTVQNNLVVNGSATFNGSVSGVSASAKSGIFWENNQTVTSNYTITNGQNAMSAGPITINSGVTVTIGDGEVWSVV